MRLRKPALLQKCGYDSQVMTLIVPDTDRLFNLAGQLLIMSFLNGKLPGKLTVRFGKGLVKRVGPKNIRRQRTEDEYNQNLYSQFRKPSP